MGISVVLGRRTIRLLCVAVVGLASLTSCSAGRDDPRDAVELLAAGLEKRDLSDVPGAARSQRDLTRIVEGMGETEAAVTVGEVSEDGDTATATLRTTWAFDGDDWTYTTRVELGFVDDAWQVRWSPDIVAPELQDDELLGISTTQAQRGDILGADDEPIVTSRDVLRIGIDKTRVEAGAAPDAARKLARLIDLDPDTYAERVESAGTQAFVIGLVVRADSEDALSVAELEDIPGAVQLEAQQALAPTRTFGQPMLGVVGEATAEIVEKSEGAVRSGDQVGLSGLALRYDAGLRGAPGVRVDAVSTADATERRELFSSEPTPGEPLRTTIDVDLQGSADEILAGVGPASAIVAIRPSTGDVLALASGAGGDGADTAASGRYAPGSTFKLVTALAFLRSGLKPSTEVPCTRTVTVDGRRFTNYSDYPAGEIGDISLQSAIASSCNTAMIATRDKAQQDDLADAAAALGLGPDLDLGYPAFLGSVPAEASGTERAASMIGQGRIEASPLAMAVVAASIARGERVTPSLLAGSPTQPAPAAAEPLTAGEAEQLRQMWRAVVTDGSGAFLADVPGDAVSAKTGTAEYGDDSPPRTHAWMIATQGDLAVAVFVADGESGSQTAGPLLEGFLRSVS